MKKTLREELERIHGLTYGKQKFLDSNFTNKLKLISEQTMDDPKKADLVSPDVQDFFETLRKASESGGLSQQTKGSMTFQKEVESMQIGLILLGYTLPKYGVDGLFGPETANAVSKFITDNVGQTSDNLSEVVAMVQLDDTNYTNVDIDADNTKYDEVSKPLLDDIQKAATAAGVTVKITTATSGHGEKVKGSENTSRHKSGGAVDISIINDKPVISNREDTNKFVNELVKLGYVKNKESGNQKSVLTYGFPGHDNHVHISNKIDSTSIGGSKIVTATSDMLNKLIELLRQRGVKSEELKSYIDKSINVSDVNDTNYYIRLLKTLGAPESEENLKFLYAWRQAEGKSGKYNPFNTTHSMPGATNFNKVGVKNYSTLEDGFVATIKTLRNGRYNCIINGLVNDIGADNIARCESLKTWGTGNLVAKVVSTYNRGSEPKVPSLA